MDSDVEKFVDDLILNRGSDFVKEVARAIFIGSFDPKDIGRLVAESISPDVLIGSLPADYLNRVNGDISEELELESLVRRADIAIKSADSAIKSASEIGSMLTDVEAKLKKSGADLAEMNDLLKRL